MKDKIVHVEEYTKDDGTKVREHQRIKPDNDGIIFEMEPFFTKKIKIK